MEQPKKQPSLVKRKLDKAQISKAEIIRRCRDKGARIDLSTLHKWDKSLPTSVRNFLIFSEVCRQAAIEAEREYLASNPVKPA